MATTTEVYNEFSSGVQDPSAIRLFAKSIYDQSASKKPRYLLLFGAVSYDYKDIYGLRSSFVPTFSPDENAADRKYLQLYEDAFGYLENGEGLLPGTYAPSYQGDMDMAVGRIPVHTTEEADAMVRKIQRYSARQYVPDDPAWRRQGNFGPWKNDVVFVGGQEFIRDMERWISQTMEEADTLLNIHKPKSVIRLAECVSCFRRGMLLCILFASVRIMLLATPRRSPLRLRLGEKHAA